MNEIFSYEYVWVNDGNWQHSSTEEKAIMKAKSAAMDANLWDEIYSAPRMILYTVPCNQPEDHTMQYALIFLVSFWASPVLGPQ